MRPGTLFAVKLGAVFLLVVMPLLALQLVLAARIGVGGRDLGLVLLETTLYASILVAGACTLAAWSRDFAQFVLRAAAIVIVVLVAFLVALQIVSSASGGRAWFRPAGFELATLLLALPLLAQAAWLAVTRRPGRAAPILFAVGLGVIFVVRPLAWVTSGPDERRAVTIDAANQGPELSLVSLV